MDLHVDWLTWTMKPRREVVTPQDLYYLAKKELEGLSNEHVAWIFDGQGFDRAVREGNFAVCLQRDDHGVRLAGASPTGYIKIDATGRACDSIRKPGQNRVIVSEVTELLTRIDFALDVRTDVLPAAIANTRSHQGFRTISFIRSDTGETCYVGSPKSDRYCRVYRYNKPHPRSELLRLEFVFRRGLARAAAGDYIASPTDEEFAGKLLSTWGFVHAALKDMRRTDERIKTPSFTRHQEDTIAWLYKQVAPALRKLLSESSFDMADWLETVYNQ